MTLATILPLLLSMVASIVGGGFLGAWLTHVRLSPKSRAEARSITAAAIDKDWARFEREIGRLVKRCESAEDASERAIKGQRECEAREAKLAAEILRLKAVNDARAEVRTRAQEVVAADRAAQRGI